MGGKVISIKYLLTWFGRSKIDFFSLTCEWDLIKCPCLRITLSPVDYKI